MDSGEGDGGLELSIVLGEGLEAPDRCGKSETMPERPESLFKDWAMEVCVRSSSKIVGVRDQYYYDLMSHHHFRSKKEVEYFQLTGMIRRYTPKSKKPATNKRSELRFDFKNHQMKVSWVLTNFPEGMWTSCKEGRQSRHGIHGWPQWKTSTVACMHFSSDGGDTKTQIDLEMTKGGH